MLKRYQQASRLSATLSEPSTRERSCNDEITARRHPKRRRMRRRTETRIGPARDSGTRRSPLEWSDRASNQLPKLLDESPYFAGTSVAGNQGSRTDHSKFSACSGAGTAQMGAQKRKRSDLRAEDGQDGAARNGAPRRTYKTGKEFQSAIEFASKDCK